MLRHADGWCNAEIADEFGYASAQSAAVAISRAKKKVRERFASPSQRRAMADQQRVYWGHGDNRGKKSGRAPVLMSLGEQSGRIGPDRAVDQARMGCRSSAGMGSGLGSGLEVSLFEGRFGSTGVRAFISAVTKFRR